MKKVRWPNGRVTELNDQIAERIAFKGGCMIVAAVPVPTAKTMVEKTVKKATRKRGK